MRMTTGKASDCAAKWNQTTFLGSIKAPYPEFGNTSNFKIYVFRSLFVGPLYIVPTRVYDKTLH